MKQVTLTPIDPNVGGADFEGKLRVYNSFIGGHTYGFPGFYNVQSEFRGRQYLSRQYLWYCVEESPETLYENRRLLLVDRENYSSNYHCYERWKENLVQVMVTFYDLSEVRGRTIMVIFDIEALRESNVQLFFHFWLQETLLIEGRDRRAILFYIPSWWERNSLFFHLRPKGNEIYINSIDIHLF